MNSKSRICQNCKKDFTVGADDFAFYEKIQVPPPTFCPECRMVRRLSSQNQRDLYKRKCDLCQKDIIAYFPAESESIVYCQKCWWSDDWGDPMQYGRDYDFSKPFFQQFKELLDKIPRSSLQTVYTTMVNSEYCNIASYLKNCYLMFNSDYSEDCYYGTYVERSKKTFDVYMGDQCEVCYESNNLFKCYHVFYSSNCSDCLNVYFSKNLRGCSDCFGCVNLSNRQHYIFNQPYSKEEYFKKLEEFDLGSRKSILGWRKKMEEIKLRFPRKFAEGIKNKEVSGDYVFNSKNTHLSYEVTGCEDCKYCHFLFIEPTRDAWDVTMWGGGLSRGYDCMGVGGGADSIKFSLDCWANLIDIEYCFDLLVANSNLFGCIGLRNKKFCILNKQYSEEEYKDLVLKIKKHMDAMPYVDKKGRIYKYGEFFPVEIHPFAYNESIVQEFFPLEKEEAISRGFNWKEAEEKDYKITAMGDQLIDNIKGVADDVLDKIVGCEHRGECREQCTLAFRITPRELEFYRTENIPLPRLCPNCRHYERMKNNNPVRFFKRRCQCSGHGSENGVYANTGMHLHGDAKCVEDFETSYAPDRPEIIYCEQCYQAEVS